MRSIDNYLWSLTHKSQTGLRFRFLASVLDLLTANSFILESRIFPWGEERESGKYFSLWISLRIALHICRCFNIINMSLKDKETGKQMNVSVICSSRGDDKVIFRGQRGIWKNKSVGYRSGPHRRTSSPEISTRTPLWVAVEKMKQRFQCFWLSLKLPICCRPSVLPSKAERDAGKGSRAMPGSAVTQEPCSCSRWEQNRDIQTMRRAGDLRILSTWS